LAKTSLKVKKGDQSIP